MKPVTVKSIPVKPAESTVKSTPMKPVESTVESAPVKPAKSAAMKPAAAVETSAPAMPSVGGIWLAERGSAQQSSSDCQSPSTLRPSFMFV